jgi:hypothetical protein
LIYIYRTNSSLNTETNTWKKVAYFEQRYDQNGNDVYYLDFDWKEELNDFVPFHKEEKAYDENNQIISFDIYYWNRNTNDWYRNNKTEYSYDEYGNKLTETLTGWAYQSDSISYIEIFTYYYSSLGVSVLPTVSANKTIGIYPNPVTDGFRIFGLSENAQVVLSDLSGRVVLRKKDVADNVYISMGSLPQGVYLVQMITGNEIITKKLVKKE